MDVRVAELLAFGPVAPTPPPRDRSPQSLAMLLAKAAERVRTDPAANLEHCAVRGAAEILRIRLDERIPVSPGDSTRDGAPGVDDAD